MILDILKSIFQKLMKTRTVKAFLRQLPFEEDTAGRLSWLLNPNNLKLVGLIILGVVGIVALVRNAWQKYTYRSALAGEMKKQLEPLYEKLETLEEQNEELKRQNDELLERIGELS